MLNFTSDEFYQTTYSLTMNKSLNRHLFKEDIQMASKLIKKRYLTSFQKGNANQNHTEISLDTHKGGYNFKNGK